jgi:hypothetical protein
MSLPRSGEPGGSAPSIGARSFGIRAHGRDNGLREGATMPVARSAGVIAAAIGLVVSGSTRAQDVSRNELVRKLQELRGKVEQLETKQQQQQQQQQQEQAGRSDSRVVDETVARVLADADRRSRFLMQDVSITGGFDSERSRYFLASSDGNWLLMPGVLFQFRNTTNFREGTKNGDDDLQNGFEVRRMRLIFEGTAFTPDLYYKFQWETNSSTGSVFLQDAFVRYTFAKEWGFQVGQFYDVLYHEQSMLDQYTLAADRSLVNGLIGGGQTERVQGAMLMYDNKEHWRGQLLFHDGFNSDNTDFTDTGGGGTSFVGVTPTDFGFSGRMEYFFSGTRKAYDDFTALDTKQDLLVVGGGFDYTDGNRGSVLFHTVDAQYENTNGLGIYAAFLGTYRDIRSPGAALPPVGDFYDWGFLVQGSYLFTPKLEVFARYDFTKLDDDALAAGAEDNVYEITLGVNHYFQRHNVKLTLDGTWLPNGSPTAVRGLGVLVSDDDQFIFRGQFQLLI